jgi:hypothetical protein
VQINASEWLHECGSINVLNQSKWNVIFVCGYGCERKKPLLKNYTSLYLNMFGLEAG